MKWPWKRDHPQEGSTARQEAERHLADTRARWPEVRTVAGSLRDLRERNHFAEAIEESMRRRGT